LSRNLLFDLDGTLTDPKDGIVRSVNYALGKFGLPACESSEIEPFIGPPLKETFRAILDTNDDETLMRAVSWYRERYIARGYMENHVYDGIPELLAACRSAGFRLFIATSKRKDIAQQVLDHFGLAPAFEAVYGCDVDLSKTELLSILVRENDLRVSDCLMIGDRRHDIEAGRANGMLTIGVLWGYGTLDELIAAGSHYLTHTPAELSHVINQTQAIL